MRCPVCQQSLHETSPACPHCSFDLAVAEKHLGIAPQLRPDLTDLAGVLSNRQHTAILRVLREKERRFPQVRFAVVTVQIPPQTPLRAYSFWLLNRGSLASQMEKGGACRLVLLVVDAAQYQLCCMLGYGLEPLVGETALQNIVRPARAMLSRRDLGGAIHACLHQADKELAAISHAIPIIFGLEPENATPSLSADNGFAY